jgi:hypothetical protein
MILLPLLPVLALFVGVFVVGSIRDWRYEVPPPNEIAPPVADEPAPTAS